MKEKLFIEFWNKAKTAYPSGTSKHTNAIFEDDFDSLIESIVKICNMHCVMQSALFANWLKEQPLILVETGDGMKWKGSYFGSKYYKSEELYEMFINGEHFV